MSSSSSTYLASVPSQQQQKLDHKPRKQKEVQPPKLEPSNKFGNACLRCRARKVKCDGRRPECLNCSRKSYECVFDIQPKRRGPDKLPGRKRRTAAQKLADQEAGIDLKTQRARENRPSSSSSSTDGLQRIPAHSSSPEPSQNGGGGGAGPSKRRKSAVGVKLERVEDDEHFQIRPSSSHRQNGGGRGHTSGSGGQDRDGGSASTPSSTSSTSSSVFPHQDQSFLQQQHHQGGYSPYLPLLQHQFELSNGYPFNPHQQNQHHQNPHRPLHPAYHHQPSMGQGSSTAFSYYPQLPHNPNPNPPLGQQSNTSHQQHPSRQQQHHPDQQYQGSHHQQQRYPPYHSLPDHFFPYQNPPSASTSSSQVASQYAYPLPQAQPFSPLSSHQQQQQQQQNFSNPPPPLPTTPYSLNHHSNGDGHVDSTSRPRTAPQPGLNLNSQSSPFAIKRRASDAGLDQSQLGFYDVREADEEGDEGQQPLHDADQSVFRVGGGEASMTVAVHEEQWEQQSKEGQGPVVVCSVARLEGEALPATELAKRCSPMLNSVPHPRSRPSTGTSQPSSVSSMMVTTPLPSPLQNPVQSIHPSNLTLPKTPTTEYVRQIWWDHLLSQFGRNRNAAYAEVVLQLSNLFKISNHWVAFVNIPLFVAKLHHPLHRQNLQPALVYSMLALGCHLSSWDGPGGRSFEGRLLALQFKDQALAAFWTSWNSGWIDAGLAKAAFVMAVYEASGNPAHSDQRAASAMLLLDNVMRTLALPALDVSDPNANMFPNGQIPMVAEGGSTVVAPMTSYSNLGLQAEQSTTNCPFWAACPRWSNPRDQTPVSELEKDETRRVVWSASALAASFSMYRYAIGVEPLELYIGNPENFALLFPGESLFKGKGGKTSIWALYATTAMLWHFALQTHLSNSPEEEKRNQAVKVWTVSRTLEAMFDKAKQRSPVADDASGEDWFEKLGKLAYDWQSRDWLLTSRMLVSNSFSKFIPDATSHGVINEFHAASARQWLYTQAAVAKSLNPVNSMTCNSSSDSRSLINHRPVWIFWFMQQLSKAIQLYELNPEFTEALTVIRDDLAPMLQTLLNLYPSAGLFDTLTTITARLNQANHRAGFSEVVLHFPAVLNSEEVQEIMARRPLGGELEGEAVME